VQAFREVRRVLRQDGTLWLNLGDSYSNGGRSTRDANEKLDARGMGSRPTDGRKPKDLLGVPWMAAFALQADGWWLRSDIVWAKVNPMPESITDRPTRAHEMLFLLTPSQRYFYDHVAIRDVAVQNATGKAATFRRESGNKREQVIPGQSKGTHRPDRPEQLYNGAYRNKRDVWAISTKPYKGAHFAVMPPDLVEPCILAGTSEAGCCPHCGAPWERVVVRRTSDAPSSYNGSSFQRGKSKDARVALASVGEAPRAESLETVGWKATCDCPTHDPVPCIVLDPFSGSGTVAMVAHSLDRDAWYVDASQEYLRLAQQRLAQIPRQTRLCIG
jgi:DNA modification methylase